VPHQALYDSVPLAVSFESLARSINMEVTA